MNSRALRAAMAVTMMTGLTGCDLLGGGGGGGGTGGGSAVTFTKGYAFVRKDDRNVYVANEADVNTVVRLTTEGGARQPSLSKDGKRVVFVRTVGTDTELATVPSSGGTVSAVLAATTISGRNLRGPVFSPDGARIAFAYDEGSSSSIGLVNPDGTGFARLAGGSALAYGSPSFSADGTTVLAAAGNSNTLYTQLEKLDVATGAPTPVTNTLGLEVVNGIGNRVVMSPDGTRATFDARISSGSTRVFVIDLSNPSAINRLTDYPSDEGANDSFPMWVGATKVGFSSDTGGNDQVYALDATATNTSGGLQLPSALEPWYGPN